jgi:hypothetical protein
MTLDRRAFIREMTLLEERFNRQHSDQVLARYYDTLSAKLTTSEFEAAARHVFDNDQFWPAPARFVDLAHGSSDAQARSEWSALISAAARGERARLTPEGEAALMAIGGWHEVAYADTDRKLPRLERSFVKRYEDASESREMQRHTPALKNGPVSTTERGVNFPVALDIDA